MNKQSCLIDILLQLHRFLVDRFKMHAHLVRKLFQQVTEKHWIEFFKLYHVSHGLVFIFVYH